MKHFWVHRIVGSALNTQVINYRGGYGRPRLAVSNPGGKCFLDVFPMQRLDYGNRPGELLLEVLVDLANSGFAGLH